MNKEELIINMERCLYGIAQVDCEYCPHNGKDYCTRRLMLDALNYIKEEKTGVAGCGDVGIEMWTRSDKV